MKRKVIKQGPTTLMMSLPAKWVKKYDVSKGDLLDVEEMGNSLKIATDKVIEVAPLEFDTNSLDIKHIKKYLHEIYQSGYDEVRILFESPKLVPAIQNYISSVMIGYEIVDQQEHSLTVKSISQSIEEEFDPILRRSFLVTKQLGANSLELIKGREFNKLKDILILEDTNDKLTNFCLRVLNKKGYKDFSKTTFIYCLIWQLEKIADEYRYLCSYLIDNEEVKLSKEVLDLYQKVNGIFGEFYELFYSFSKERLTKFSADCEKLLEIAVKVQSGSKGSQDVIIGHLYVMVSYMYTMMGPLIGLRV